MYPNWSSHCACKQEYCDSNGCGSGSLHHTRLSNSSGHSSQEWWCRLWRLNFFHPSPFCLGPFWPYPHCYGGSPSLWHWPWEWQSLHNTIGGTCRQFRCLALECQSGLHRQNLLHLKSWWHWDLFMCVSQSTTLYHKRSWGNNNRSSHGPFKTTHRMHVPPEQGICHSKQALAQRAQLEERKWWHEGSHKETFQGQSKPHQSCGCRVMQWQLHRDPSLVPKIHNKWLTFYFNNSSSARVSLKRHAPTELCNLCTMAPANGLTPSPWVTSSFLPFLNQPQSPLETLSRTTLQLQGEQKSGDKIKSSSIGSIHTRGLQQPGSATAVFCRCSKKILLQRELWCQ